MSLELVILKKCWISILFIYLFIQQIVIKYIPQARYYSRQQKHPLKKEKKKADQNSCPHDTDTMVQIWIGKLYKMPGGNTYYGEKYSRKWR